VSRGCRVLSFPFDRTETIVRKALQPDAVAGWRGVDGLAGESCAEALVLAALAEATAACGVRRTILQRAVGRVGALTEFRQSRISLGPSPHVERLARAPSVAPSQKGVEPRPLLREAGPNGLVAACCGSSAWVRARRSAVGGPAEGAGTALSLPGFTESACGVCAEMGASHHLSYSGSRTDARFPALSSQILGNGVSGYCFGIQELPAIHLIDSKPLAISNEMRLIEPARDFSPSLPALLSQGEASTAAVPARVPGAAFVGCSTGCSCASEAGIP
jgi:hypothetical protein